MILIEASLNPPQGLAEFIFDLGEGENGFSDTPVHSGDASLLEYLQTCIDGTDESKLKPGWVPQTIYWLLDTEEKVVGMVKVRHRLSQSTRINGGHVGFYIHPAHRGKGFGKQAFALALSKLKRTGATKALVTVYPENAPSIRIVQANGGQFENCMVDPITGHEINRYWIRLVP